MYTPIEEYTYDALNQLTQVDYLTQNKRVVYTYNSGGNITKEKIYTVADDGTATLSDTKSYVYGDANWRDKLTKYDGQTITYDGIGNPLVYRDGMTMSWSNGRQLQSLTKDGETVNYVYDDSGMRLSKTVDGVEYTYLYQNGLLVQETVGNRILDYSYDSNGRLSMVRYRIPANNYDKCFYYALNSRGDVIGLYSDTGTLMAKYNYDVWGNVLSVTNTTGAEITTTTHIALLQPFRYRSYYYDKESNFYYLQSRYYDPVTHRFINADGLVSTGTGILGHNMFAYCENNPINNYDPTGQFLTKLKEIILDVLAKLFGSSSSTGSAKPYEHVPGSKNKNSPNCYAYAIGSSVNEQPGYTSGRVPDKYYDVYDVGKSVKADLNVKGYTVRVISGPNGKILDSEYRIALRVGTTPFTWHPDTYEPCYDYHFMRQTDTGPWSEKHGIGGDSILHPVGMTPDTLPWILSGYEYYDSPIIYFAIGN